MTKKIKTREEILEKNGIDFDLFLLENEHSAKNLLISMQEYADQFKIELPTDEEIEKQLYDLPINVNTKGLNLKFYAECLYGAMWMRDKIKEQLRTE